MTSETATLIAAVVGQGTIFATIVFNAWAQRKREERKRRWDIEDRAGLAAKVHATAEVLAAKVDDTTAGIRAAIAENTLKTEEATSAAHDAYKEANNVNMKIAELSRRQNETGDAP